ncbi:hypothetical protein ACH47Z_35030 [Streptomyces sp. NPDC020192]|uniref:hypothetical protein n=1 Tax=Streptomyces sp. NPDC020192 TaxID=3365066 RepID=UPI00378F8C2A
MPVSDEEGGGVRGLRTWADDAMARARRLTPGLTPDAVPLRAGVVPRRDYGTSVAELEQLTRLLDHDPRLRSAVGVRLGGAPAMRHLAWGGEAAERERAETLLRQARDPGGALGATAAEEDRRWAALFLLALIAPLPPQPALAGAAPDLSAFLAWAERAGPDLAATAAREAAVRDHRTDPAVEQAWEETLDALCDWAHAHEVLAPVLADPERRLLGRSEGEGAALGRAPRGAATAPVLPADPGMALPYAEVEVRLCGTPSTGRPGCAAGSPSCPAASRPPPAHPTTSSPSSTARPRRSTSPRTVRRASGPRSRRCIWRAT